MTTTSFTFLPAIFLISGLSNFSFAQLATDSAKQKLLTSFEPILAYNKSTGKNADGDYLNNVDAKALRHFATLYENASEIRWAILPGGFRVHFVNAGIDTRIYYTKKGAPEATVRYYFEKDMPHEVRHIIKTTYYDFSIFCVTEITMAGKTAYLVKIEDRTCWKTVKVVDNEMEITENIQKVENNLLQSLLIGKFNIR